MGYRPSPGVTGREPEIAGYPDEEENDEQGVIISTASGEVVVWMMSDGDEFGHVLTRAEAFKLINDLQAALR